MNTGFLRHAVATVLTVYGIETKIEQRDVRDMKLQQCLPFTVLKRVLDLVEKLESLKLQQCLPFTVLKLLE